MSAIGQISQSVTRRWRAFERYLGIDAVLDPVESIRARGVYTFAIGFLIVQLFNQVSLYQIYGQFRIANLLAAIIVVLMIGTIWLMPRYKVYRHYVYFYIGLLTFGVGAAAFGQGTGINNALVIYFASMPMLIGILGGPRTAFISGVIALIMASILYLLTENPPGITDYPFANAAEHRFFQTIYATIVGTAMAMVFSGTLFSALSRLHEAARMARKAELSKTEFVTRMSHELRTPLNGVIGLSAALNRSDLTEEQRKLAEPLNASAEHLLAIVNDVLDYSKLEAGFITLNPIIFEPRRLIESVVSNFSAIADEKGLALTVSVQDDVPVRCEADVLRIRQILSNLIENALKFTDQGEVNATLRTCDDLDGQCLCFSVSDTGSGVTPGNEELIFDRFVQSGEYALHQKSGTGLGLTISRQLARAMGGDLYLRKTGPSGSTFEVQIVVKDVPSTTETLATDCDDENKKPLEGLHVLVVDDGERNLLVTQALLHSQGATSKTASSGFACLEALQAERFDVVILDKRMPEMDGIETLARIRELGPEVAKTPVIACTADARDDEAEQLRRVGFDGYIPKPITIEAIFKAINQAARSI